MRKICLLFIIFFLTSCVLEKRTYTIENYKDSGRKVEVNFKRSRTIKRFGVKLKHTEKSYNEYNELIVKKKIYYFKADKYNKMPCKIMKEVIWNYESGKSVKKTVLSNYNHTW